jgi:hypothetical protein
MELLVLRVQRVLQAHQVVQVLLVQ